MGSCLQCGTEIRLGGLCTKHAEEIATSSDVTAEQIVGRPPAEPVAALIDQWGHVHGLADRSVIGRVHDECAVTILHHSVSAIHAQIEQTRAQTAPGGDPIAWRVVDRGSLNGTFVDDEQVRTAPLRGGERVRFGSVSFYFSFAFSARSRQDLQQRSGPGQTVPTRLREVAFQALVSDGSGTEFALVQRAAGGIVRVDEDTSLEFARLEFGLLKILAERRIKSPDPELSFVSSQELAELLEFKSADADGENVRELVRRVRRKFKSEGITDLIESRQGVGYRLAWAVKS